MFNKAGVVISTASGAGANKITKALKQQLFWLGISTVFKYSKNVNASSWDTVSNEIEKSIEKDVDNFQRK